jgi:hypothetical protein
LVDVEGRTLYVKLARLKTDSPIWISLVPGQKGVYRLSTISTRHGVTRDVTVDAYSLVGLRRPEYRHLFPKLLLSVDGEDVSRGPL